MGKKCHTKDNEFWISEVAEQFEGAFIITSEDGDGNFEGIHNGQEIKGTCTGTHITFKRPATRPVFEYEGKFNGAGDEIHGTRTSARRSAKAPENEDWEGTKTTTLLNRKGKKKR